MATAIERAAAYEIIFGEGPWPKEAAPLDEIRRKATAGLTASGHWTGPFFEDQHSIPTLAEAVKSLTDAATHARADAEYWEGWVARKIPGFQLAAEQAAQYRHSEISFSMSAIVMRDPSREKDLFPKLRQSYLMWLIANADYNSRNFKPAEADDVSFCLFPYREAHGYRIYHALPPDADLKSCDRPELNWFYEPPFALTKQYAIVEGLRKSQNHDEERIYKAWIEYCTLLKAHLPDKSAKLDLYIAGCKAMVVRYQQTAIALRYWHLTDECIACARKAYDAGSVEFYKYYGLPMPLPENDIWYLEISQEKECA